MFLALFSAPKFREKEVPFKEGNAKFACFTQKSSKFYLYLNFGFKIPIKAENCEFKAPVDTLQPYTCGSMSKLQNYWLL